MKQLVEMRSDGPTGPMYFRYAERRRIDRSGVREDDEGVVIDFAADGSVVGVELASTAPRSVDVLGKVAVQYGLDLGPVFARDRAQLQPA